ncbi:AtpZ/AtpI family protein [Parvibaculum sp.]|uniref:AtpZ/AtpI family protein n=1 Tax=Parvibaculum sp. TaxID=2024848 RepID=UPI00320DBD08
MNVALRLSSEFVSGVVVGAAIGWGLDWVFGTMPLCLVIFTGLGTVAGVRNVLRATRAYDEAHKSGGVKQDQSGQSPADKR